MHVEVNNNRPQSNIPKAAETDITVGSAVLHELIQIPFPDVASGISNPIAIDKVYHGMKLYGPSNAKALAFATVGGADVAIQNVDNLVYTALASYGQQQYPGTIVDLPVKGWTYWRDELWVDNSTILGDGSLHRDGVWDLQDSYYTISDEEIRHPIED